METSAITTAVNASTGAQNKAAISSDFDTFLKMMTVQLKNQDPLNPVDSADYAMQLATYSGVEQQIRTNSLLEGLTSQFDVLGMAQLAGWVGQEARSAAPVAFDGGSVAISYAANGQADRAVLVVRNADGAVVAREDVPVSDTDYIWLGGNAVGDPLPDGVYALTLESYRGDQQLGDATAVHSYARITEARSGTDGPVLVLAGGVSVAANQITGLRAS